MEQALDKKEKLLKEIKGIGLGAVGLFILIALASFNSSDLSFNSYSATNETHNLGGRFGAQLADAFLQLLGLAAYGLPIALLYLSYRTLRYNEVRWRSYKLIAFFILLVTLSALFAFNFEFTELFGQRVQTGGWIGFKTADLLKRAFGVIGALLILLPILASAIMVLSRFSFLLFADWWLKSVKNRFQRSRQRRALNSELLDKEHKFAPAGAPVIKTAPIPAPVTVPAAKKEKKQDEKKTAAVQETFEFIKSDGNYQTPPLSLLDAPQVQERKLDKESLTMNARLLEKKLKDFGIDGEVVEICPGPVITMYEFSPAPGIKVSRIAGLADDLTMALQAMSIRIVAPIPGKGVVGIELPNRDRDMVSLQGDLQLRGIPSAQDEAAAGSGQGYRRGAACDRPGQNAASAGGRRHRLRQIGRHQHHDPLPALHLHPQRCAHHHGRPEDAGALRLRGDPAPAAAGGHRTRRRRRWRSNGR